MRISLTERFINYCKNGIDLLENEKKEKFKTIGIAYKNDEDLKDVIEYSIDNILRYVSKIFLLFGLAILGELVLGLKNLVLITLIQFISNTIIRNKAKGLHTTTLKCTLFGISTSILGYFFSVNFVLNTFQKIIIFILCFIIFYLYAPNGSPLEEITKENYIPLKRMTLVLSLILFVISFVMPYIFQNAILSSLITQSLGVMPVIYKIFREEAFNYEKNSKMIQSFVASFVLTLGVTISNLCILGIWHDKEAIRKPNCMK